MSDLTIGKIVNNSATLVLNSTDQDGFGEKIVTNDNFIPIHAPGGGADKNYPDPVYKVINDDFGQRNIMLNRVRDYTINVSDSLVLLILKASGVK